jgi:hypothetical protein
MSISTDIKNHIKANVQSCASVQQVYGHEEVNPSGFPAVMVTAADMDGEFSSNSQNSHVYSFKLLILFPIGQDYPVTTNMNRMEYAEQVIATVIDEIVNISDTDFELAGSDRQVLFVNAADVSWGYLDYEAGKARSAELTLRVYTEKTVI